MAFLQADHVRMENGVQVKEKLIPWDSRWSKCAAGFVTGEKFKADLLLSDGTGRVQGVTIHNTGRITVPEGTTMAEQYTRATWPNQNMNSVRVHYYVDSTGAWQNLREDEVGWHAGDGSYGRGNNTTLAIEIIMDGSGDAFDRASEDNGARLAAALLHRHGLGTDALLTHWELSPVGKYCPQYLLPRWDGFRERVQRYLEALRYPAAQPAPVLPVSQQPVPEQEQPVSEPIYRVQVGYFRNKEYARQLLDRLQKAGFEGFIRQENGA